MFRRVRLNPRGPWRKQRIWQTDNTESGLCPEPDHSHLISPVSSFLGNVSELLPLRQSLWLWRAPVGSRRPTHRQKASRASHRSRHVRDTGEKPTKVCRPALDLPLPTASVDRQQHTHISANPLRAWRNYVLSFVIDVHIVIIIWYVCEGIKGASVMWTRTLSIDRVIRIFPSVSLLPSQLSRRKWCRTWMVDYPCWVPVAQHFHFQFAANLGKFEREESKGNALSEAIVVGSRCGESLYLKRNHSRCFDL